MFSGYDSIMCVSGRRKLSWNTVEGRANKNVFNSIIVPLNNLLPKRFVALWTDLHIISFFEKNLNRAYSSFRVIRIPKDCNGTQEYS